MESLYMYSMNFIFVVVFAQNKQKRTKGFVNVRDINQG